MTDKSSELADLDRSSDLIHAASGANQFATDLYSKLAASHAGDIVFSPNSVMLALAMTLAGARGETAKEMAETLRLQISPDRIHEAFRALQATELANDVELRIANRLWCQTGYHFLADYLSLTERCYGSKMADVDFRNHTEDARRQINDWIDQQTEGKIQNLIGPGALDAMTRLVLTNAVYFLGGWQDEFEEVFTKTAPFWSRSGEDHPVQMMHQTDRFRYGDFDDVQVLEMPYRHRMKELREGVSTSNQATTALAMTIILPRTIDGLSEVESALSPLKLREWTQNRSYKVDVAIPKFRIESSFQMSDALRSMGMQKAFSIEADFFGISDDPEGLFIGEVVHKTFIDVNEKGTEAAAATAMLMFGGSAYRPEPLKTFRADHPFLFLIRDKNTRLIHCMGRVTR